MMLLIIPTATRLQIDTPFRASTNNEIFSINFLTEGNLSVTEVFEAFPYKVIIPCISKAILENLPQKVILMKIKSQQGGGGSFPVSSCGFIDLGSLWPVVAVDVWSEEGVSEWMEALMLLGAFDLLYTCMNIFLHLYFF